LRHCCEAVVRLRGGGLINGLQIVNTGQC